MSLVPRYPLFGGWSSTFTFGYSLPLSSAVGKVRCNPSCSLLQGACWPGESSCSGSTLKGCNVARQLTPCSTTQPALPHSSPLGCRSPRRAVPCLPLLWAPPWKTWWPTLWWLRCAVS